MTYVAAERPSTTSVVKRAPAAPNRSARWAAWTFAGVVAVAVPLILYQGRDQWFLGDDFDFLADRNAGSFHDLMEPHVQHWTTFPILVYRALWRLVGINHYWPYQLCLVALHLTAAILLRAVMRRAGVHPWIATAAASLFVVFGSGRQDIILAFQIAFTGALAFGLAHVLLADHDGRFDRRDAIGVGFGVLSLMCSAVGVVMVLAAAIAVLIRRGWRMAVAHTAPLAAVFVLWSVTYGRDAPAVPKSELGSVVAFVRDQFVAVFNGLGQLPGVGVVLAIVVVVGVPLAVSRQTWAQFRQSDGPTVGLAVAAVAFSVTTGYERAFGGSFPSGGDASRYVYVVAALLLPMVALAASALVDRWRVALPLGMALFLVGVPQNVVDLHTTRAEALLVGDPDLILTMARLPVARVVPRDLNPFQLEQIGFPIGWLLDGVASGRVPEPATVDEGAIAEAELMLSVYQTTDAPTGACVPIPPHTPVRVRQGDVIKINSRKVSLRRWSNGRIVTDASYTAAGLGRTLRIVGVPLDLIVQPTPADQPAELCR